MVRSKILILILSAAALGCSKATPTFDLTDDANIPRPKFNGADTINITVSNSTTTFTVNGTCDHKIRGIKGMLVGIATSFSVIGDITATNTVTCATTGTFTLEFKSLQTLGWSNFYDGKTMEIHLKGMTSAGISRASKIFITYDSGTGNKNIWFASGGVHGAGDTASFAGGGNAAFNGAELYMMHTNRDPAGSPSNASFKLRVGADAR